MVVGIIVARYIALPLICTLVVKIAVRLNSVHADPVYQFVLLLQFVVPPAMNMGKVHSSFTVFLGRQLTILLAEDNSKKPTDMRHMEHKLLKISRLDGGKEFINAILIEFCKDNGIVQKFSAVRTSQQNGVVERKNRTLVEAARTMLQDAKLPTSFWEEVVNTACYTQNRYLINKNLGKSPYSILSKRKPNVKHLHVFGSKCYILKDNYKYVGKFDSKVFEIIFLGYSLERIAYKVYVLEQKKITESTDVTFDDAKCQDLECLDENEAEALKFENLNIDSDYEDEVGVNTNHRMDEESTGQVNHENGRSSQSPEFDSTNSGRKWDRSHTREVIIGDPNAGVRTRSVSANESLHACFLSQVKPKKTEEILLNPDWISAMQEELNQFERNKVWELAPATKNKREERIDYDETFSPVARLEAIRIFLAFAVHSNFKVYQLDVKSAFLNEFLLKHGFTRGTIDKTLFYKRHGDDMILVQIYVDDIIFGSTNEKLCQRFSNLMQSEYEMSMMGELSYFLGLQVSQKSDGIFISQTRVDKKSTSGSCQFLGQRLVSRNQLMDYGLVLHKIPIMCDNTSAISIVANPANHSKIKHTDVRYHFIREYAVNGTIELIFISTEKQLAGIFTKPLDEATFTRLIGALTANPVLYLDVLRDFWNTAVVRTVVHENHVVSIMVNCSIRSQQVEFSEDDVNVALGIPTDKMVEIPTQEELDEFMDFINYSEKISLASLNKKNLRREWSSHHRGAEHRLIMPLASRGKEIFLPRFIMAALNYKVHDIHMLNGIDITQIGNCTQVSKVIFGSLMTKNKVAVSLRLTPFMFERFRTYHYHMFDMRSNIESSAVLAPVSVEVQTQEHQHGHSHTETPSSLPIASRKPTTSSSQKGEVSKKKRKQTPLTLINESGEYQTEPESTLVKKPN
ncbi:hypothetical protein AgCh_020140 [Apium graveolens]